MMKFIQLLFIIFLFGCSQPEQRIKNAISEEGNREVTTSPLILEFLAELQNDSFSYSDDSFSLISNERIEIFKYEKCWKIDSLGDKYFTKKSFNQLYTFNSKNWASGCVNLNNAPSTLITFVIKSKSHIALGEESGGLGTSYWLKVYKVSNSKITSHWIVQTEANEIEEIFIRT